MQPVGDRHDGILYKGADGKVYFLRDDRSEPELIDRDDLKQMVDDHMRKNRQIVASKLPQEIIDILEGELKAIGKLIGAWCVWGPRPNK